MSDIAEMIYAFGGPTEMSRWSGYTPNTFSNWIERQGVPPSWHLRLMIEARRRNIAIKPGVFELLDDDAEFLRRHTLIATS